MMEMKENGPFEWHIWSWFVAMLLELSMIMFRMDTFDGNFINVRYLTLIRTRLKKQEFVIIVAKKTLLNGKAEGN